MEPTIGRIVHYTLTEHDANAINRRREDADISKISKDRIGVQIHFGNKAEAGDTFPAIIVRVWNEDRVNLQVFLDGNDTLWVASHRASDEDIANGRHGHWFWPPRV